MEMDIVTCVDAMEQNMGMSLGCVTVCVFL